MRYCVMVFFVLTAVMLGGCQMGDKTDAKPSEMDPEDLPDVRAFQDEFTHDFLQSTEETRDGYYPFVSGTGQYKMDFPAEGVIGQKAYSKKEKGYEEFPIHIKGERGSQIRINYYSYHKAEDVDIFLDNFKSKLGHNGDFKKSKKDRQSTYYTHYERNGYRTYAWYLQNEQGSGGIELIYKIDCRNEKEETCSKNKQNDRERTVDWLESVKFINEGEK